ncbi:MAG: GNAT family N-acetyltransferase [Verrucomicrobiota bacterium]
MTHRAWLTQKCSRRFGVGAQFYAVFENSNEWVGIFSVVFHEHPKVSGWAEVLDLGVSVSHRRRGYGQAILEYAASLAVAKGLCSLHVETYAQDHAALATYKRCGFRQIAERPAVNGPDDRGQVLLCKDLVEVEKIANPN